MITNFIAAIDLGTSHIVGIVGTRNASGALSIIDYQVEKSGSSMRRGYVYNVEDVVYRIKSLLLKLENKLNGAKIEKVYIGIGGQSLRSMEHTVSKVLGHEGKVTEAVLDDIEKECRNYHPVELDVFDIVSPSYFIDGKYESNPLGMNCSRIDTKYKLIVGRPVLRSSIEKTIAKRIDRKVPQILVSPIALSNLILTEDERQQGGIVIDFGAGVTSVSAHRRGRLQMLYIIPFGSHLITQDIASCLNVSEPEAERLKRAYGKAIPNKENEQNSIEINRIDGVSTIKQADLDEIVEARVREIIENVYARIVDANILKDGNYSVVIAGGGAMLKDLKEAVRNRFKMDVRIASARRDLIEGNDMIANNPEYMLAVSLLLLCKENCAKQSETKQTDNPVKPQINPEKEKEIDISGTQQQVDEREKGDGGKFPNEARPKQLSIFDRIMNQIKDATKINESDY